MTARFRPVYGPAPIRSALARAVRAVGRVRFDEDDGTWGFEAPEWLEGGETEDRRWLACGSQRQGFALRRECVARYAFRELRGSDFGPWTRPALGDTPESILTRMLREHVRSSRGSAPCPGGRALD